MKRLMLSLLISIYIPVVSVIACGPDPMYNPNGLYIFRLVEHKDSTLYVSNAQRNIDAWNRLIGQQFPYSDTYTVVYKSSIEDIRQIHDKHTLPHSLKSNDFAKALCFRDSLSEFLITAKECEQARSAINDPWYYPSHHCPYVASLKKVICVAEQHRNDTMLGDRYALQQMRAQVTLGLHQENVALWENYAFKLPKDNVLRALMVNYAVGAYQKTGQGIEADRLSMREKDYDNTCLLSRMETELRHADYDGADIGDWDRDKTHRVFSQYRQTALEALRHPTTKCKAEWYYTLAYIDDVLGDNVSSGQYLRKAEHAGGNDFIRESIHLFRIYREAKYASVNDTYEQKMYTNLRWIEVRLVRDCPSWNEVYENPWRIISNYSTYYWNDMLRRIGIGVYADRLMKAGRTMRALEVINYAENRFFKEINSPIMQNNHFGYVFQALDTRPAYITMQYIKHLQHSQDKITCFLSNGSYIDYDWLYDIAGTLYLRESNFSKAYDALGHLSENYTGDSIGNPFGDISGIHKRTTKRIFAKEMKCLERTMKSGDANKRAKAHICYAIGLHNMFTAEWKTVAYGKGYPWFLNSYTPDTHEKYVRPALARSDRLIQQARQMYTADYVRSACENYYDFVMQNCSID